jgi:hypothetical protein
MNTPASVTRPVRTAGQASVAWLVTEGVDSFFYDFDDRQYGVVLGLLTVVFSWVQVQLENHAGSGILRNPNADE